MRKSVDMDCCAQKRLEGFPRTLSLSRSECKGRSIRYCNVRIGAIWCLETMPDQEVSMLKYLGREPPFLLSVGVPDRDEFPNEGVCGM